MIQYEDILSKKIAYYGETKAAYQFAAEEYADQFKPKWISIDDELPEKETPVIVAGETMASVRMAIIRQDEFIELGYVWVLYPKFWMPLPEKPEL